MTPSEAAAVASLTSLASQVGTACMLPARGATSIAALVRPEEALVAQAQAAAWQRPRSAPLKAQPAQQALLGAAAGVGNNAMEVDEGRPTRRSVKKAVRWGDGELAQGLCNVVAFRKTDSAAELLATSDVMFSPTAVVPRGILRVKAVKRAQGDKSGAAGLDLCSAVQGPNEEGSFHPQSIVARNTALNAGSAKAQRTRMLYYYK